MIGGGAGEPVVVNPGKAPATFWALALMASCKAAWSPPPKLASISAKLGSDPGCCGSAAIWAISPNGNVKSAVVTEDCAAFWKCGSATSGSMRTRSTV